MVNKDGRYIQNLDMEKVDTIAYDYFGSHPHLYPVPEFVSISHVKTAKPWGWPEHIHPNHEWLVIKKGQLRVQIDKQEFTVEAGDFYFVQPGQTHLDEGISGELDFFTVTFQLLDPQGNHVYFLPPPFVPTQQKIKGMQSVLWPLFKKMFTEVHEQQPWCEEIVEATISQMTWMVRRRLHSSQLTPDYRRTSVGHAELVRKVDEYIKNNLNKGISLIELADAVYVSRFYLDHVFKKVTGLSPLRYALKLRMEQAKKLLAEGSMNVYEVARKMGFEDPYYFSRQFKQVAGVSPKQFQKKFQR
ncbi:MAG: AraC family transcriptional regulator [Planctomycetaceae bacterium]|nr:AraC family transcriptional regulator [Planctomycetaceae bacterium]